MIRSAVAGSRRGGFELSAMHELGTYSNEHLAICRLPRAAAQMAQAHSDDAREPSRLLLQ
ncbi:hypothetical protein CHELA1G11_12419 [Hyphomicrobiales bacterium]|nr:hypothetical protein CHELA1G11_12419 [Hyphomicrobiales bacterium]